MQRMGPRSIGPVIWVSWESEKVKKFAGKTIAMDLCVLSFRPSSPPNEPEGRKRKSKTNGQGGWEPEGGGGLLNSSWERPPQTDVFPELGILRCDSVSLDIHRWTRCACTLLCCPDREAGTGDRNRTGRKQVLSPRHAHKRGLHNCMGPTLERQKWEYMCAMEGQSAVVRWCRCTLLDSGTGAIDPIPGGLGSCCPPPPPSNQAHSQKIALRASRARAPLFLGAVSRCLGHETCRRAQSSSEPSPCAAHAVARARKPCRKHPDVSRNHQQAARFRMKYKQASRHMVRVLLVQSPQGWGAGGGHVVCVCVCMCM